MRSINHNIFKHIDFDVFRAFLIKSGDHFEEMLDKVRLTFRSKKINTGGNENNE